MKNKFENIITKTPITKIVLWSFIAFIIFYLYGLFFQASKTIEYVGEKKVVEIVDANKKKHFRKEFETGTSEISKKEVDSLKKVIEAKNSLIAIKNIEILSISKLNASITDTLKNYKLEKDEWENKVWKFKKVYEDGSKTNITMYEKDTSIIENTDLKLFVTDFSTKEKGKRKFYMDISSKNDNFRINGAKTMRVEVKKPKDLLQINLSSTYSKGIGNDMNFGISEFQFLLFPDNVVMPKIGTGFIWVLNDGKIFPYYNIGVNIRLKQVIK